ncbi:MAG TPA: hypothetical protein PLL26_06250 [Candidatus Dojkabacteria bacterium]|nr:hypothetical protein [Candidatus Dojkabacteria bacterium]
MASTQLINREFVGLVLPDLDTANQGRYKVYIPELQPHMKEGAGILAKNRVHNWRVTPSRNGIYGSYYPLQPGTYVIVKFFDNQIESAYIDKVISDHEPQCLPLKTIDRDNYYQIIRTPKYNHLIAICEDTTDKPSNSIHIYYNNQKITLVMDSTGLNINITGDANIKSSVNINIQSGTDVNIKSGAKTNIQTGGDANIKAGGNCNIDAPMINLNCGAAGGASDAAAPTLINMSDEYNYFKSQ